ncbi:hypothetical protein AVEN_193720-1 [Araneus ventricosus]|uniref:Uncharacterized protein n=1 Tax=Araneus ventricosus TaxID=182803 RepID=A0A4Y2P3R0_ARAVE|nr:hypothetical protein AVEN_193720-1 [Araneus ventricosus]
MMRSTPQCKRFLVQPHSDSPVAFRRSICEMYVGQFRVCAFAHPTTSATESEMPVSCMNDVPSISHTTPSTAQRRRFRLCNAVQFRLVSMLPTPP